jgi:hypothetical protein
MLLDDTSEGAYPVKFSMRASASAGGWVLLGDGGFLEERRSGLELRVTWYHKVFSCMLYVTAFSWYKPITALIRQTHTCANMSRNNGGPYGAWDQISIVRA